MSHVDHPVAAYPSIFNTKWQGILLFPWDGNQFNCRRNPFPTSPPPPWIVAPNGGCCCVSLEEQYNKSSKIHFEGGWKSQQQESECNSKNWPIFLEIIGILHRNPAYSRLFPTFPQHFFRFSLQFNSSSSPGWRKALWE